MSLNFVNTKFFSGGVHCIICAAVEGERERQRWTFGWLALFLLMVHTAVALLAPMWRQRIDG